MPGAFFIETFGCQMNKGDSDLMALSLIKNGFQTADCAEKADVLIFNTCSVRHHAENRALSRIRSARRDFHPAAGRLLVAAGCMAQRTGHELIKKDLADLVVGPYRSPVVGDIVQGYMAGNPCRSFLSLERNDLIRRIGPEWVTGRDPAPWHTWVTITHGCGNFCSYCIVPYVRGPLVSFHSGDILNYIARCAERGTREITLLGQNVNQYGMDSGDMPFSRLLAHAAAVPGIVKVNFLTSHPMDFSAEIIEVIRDHENISRSIHLPLQSGSDEILARMNRKYGIRDYLKLVDRVRERLEHHSLSTDLIVGFPGETGRDYELTLEAVRAIRFDEAFMYAYSPRSGTAATELPETISRIEKMDRLRRLIEIQRSISREKLISRINCTEEIIVEGLSRKSDREVMGRSFLNHPVIIPGEQKEIGEKIRVTIRGIRGSTLYGERIA